MPFKVELRAHEDDTFRFIPFTVHEDDKIAWEGYLDQYDGELEFEYEHDAPTSSLFISLEALAALVVQSTVLVYSFDRVAYDKAIEEAKNR